MTTATDPHAAAAKMFAALANSTRLRLLAALAGGGLDVTAAAGAVGLPLTDVSHHLKRLRVAGLVGRERDGQRQRYTLTPAGERAARTAAAFLEAN
jgi:DNA-binding transcriptional ArsR family regulator